LVVLSALSNTWTKVWWLSYKGGWTIVFPQTVFINI